VTQVREIMTRDVVVIDQNQTLREAVELFRSREITGAPVVEGDRVLGVVSLTDVSEFEATEPAVPTSREDRSVRDALEEEDPETWTEGDDSPSAYFVDYWSNVGAEVTSRMDVSDGPEWDRLAEHVVSEIMTRKVLSIAPDDEIRAAARLMADAGVQRVLVMSDGAIQGIVSASDIVRAVADGKI
jgi:predicted transcriptional regulator